MYYARLFPQINLEKQWLSEIKMTSVLKTTDVVFMSYMSENFSFDGKGP